MSSAEILPQWVRLAGWVTMPVGGVMLMARILWVFALERRLGDGSR